MAKPRRLAARSGLSSILGACQRPGAMCYWKELKKDRQTDRHRDIEGEGVADAEEYEMKG